MPFRVADVQKTVRSRGDGERYVHPKLLDAVAMEGPVTLTLAYFQARLGRRRRDFEPELLVRFLGEPKVARGLVACLSTTYRWRAESFADVLDARDLVRLGRRGILSPGDLRLHLFDVLNQQEDGFLSGERGAALQVLAHRLGLSAPTLDRLFSLDAEENAVLVRIGDVPDPAQVVARYNFEAVHALIRNCAYIEFPLVTGDCSRALSDAGRAYGVAVTEQDGVIRVHSRADAFGSFARWGQRVAHALYAAASIAPSLLRSGRARVPVGGRQAWYLFDRRTRSSLTGITGIVHAARHVPELGDRWQRQRPVGGTGGWQLIGMAEPLVSTAGLAVPQYAIRRDECRGLLWPVLTGAECDAVQALHAAEVPVLAIRLPGCEAALPAEIASVDWEAGVAEIVAALNSRWGGGRINAAAQALEGLLAELETRGFIPETQVGEVLGCSSLDELPNKLRTLDSARATFMPGIGLCSLGFAEAMRRGLRRRKRAKPAA